MNSNINFDHPLWYKKPEVAQQCLSDLSVDVAIVGGGMAGLSAAQAWVKRGKKVALFERDFCGAGASGKSSGFIVQNAELSLTDFSKRYGVQAARGIWDFIGSGMQDIENNIKEYAFKCQYVVQDCLLLASSTSSLDWMRTEYQNLCDGAYKTSWYDQAQLASKVNSPGYFGALAYHDAFSIDPYDYCRELKKHLESLGVLIFEQTPVTRIDDHILTTSHANITADFIIVCVDRFLPDLQLLEDDVYHVQTFILASEKLSHEHIKKMFPHDTYMAWDTQLIYNYFRLTADNRLLLGGGDVLSTYAPNEYHDYARIVKKLTHYFAQKFPEVDINFEFEWPGLIGVSKDIAPLAGPDKDQKHIFYIAASAGLSIAAALGRYSAQHLLEGSMHMDDYFSPYRSFSVGHRMQSILGKRLSFMICNALEQNIV